MKKYVLSTSTFESLEEAEARVAELENAGVLNPGTRVFRVSEVYVPKIKHITAVALVLQKKYQND